MKILCSRSYHHNNFAATHALGWAHDLRYSTLLVPGNNITNTEFSPKKTFDLIYQYLNLRVGLIQIVLALVKELAEIFKLTDEK